MKLEELILESGKLFKDTGTVTRENIEKVIKLVKKTIGKKEGIAPLGTTGKKAVSGDVDLGVDESKIKREPAVNKMTKAFGDGKKVGPDQVSFSVPYGGKANAQVDLMFGSNLEWVQFAYYADPESKYKGVVRTILLTSVTAAMNEPGTDHFEYDENGELTIRAGRTVELTKGMKRIFQYRPKKKTGEGYLKTMKSIPIDKFKDMFPDVEIKGDDVIIDDPKTVVQILFGKDTLTDDVRTAEQVLNLIKTKFNIAQQDKIFKVAKSRLSRIKGIILPGVLK
jgi:hypothetical protein